MKKTQGRKMPTKEPKAMARIDPELLRCVSVLAKALNIPQYMALEQAARDWIEKNRGACNLRLPGAPPQPTQVAENTIDWVEVANSQSQD
jgi:hypothetical protein